MSVEDLIGDLMTKLDLKSQITKCEQTTTIESANLGMSIYICTVD